MSIVQTDEPPRPGTFVGIEHGNYFTCSPDDEYNSTYQDGCAHCSSITGTWRSKHPSWITGRLADYDPATDTAAVQPWWEAEPRTVTNIHGWYLIARPCIAQREPA